MLTIFQTTKVTNLCEIKGLKLKGAKANVLNFFKSKGRGLMLKIIPL